MLKSKFTVCSLVAIAAFALGAGVNNFAFSDGIETSGIKIAVVDVSQVIASSSQVKALKTQQEAKKNELVKWLDTVKNDIQKQSTEENKAKLAKKYDKELTKKQEANRTEYVNKLTEIDKNITKVIEDNAKAKGYDIVFSKNAVLYGGVDLTSEIQKAVK